MFDLFIDDIIGVDFFGDGITAKSIRRDLAEVKPDEDIRLRINSPGGDVFEASAIISVLSGRKGSISVQVDGLAASAASWLAMLGDSVTMTDGSMLMIHDPWTVRSGNADELRKEADLLDKLGGEIAVAYGNKMGGTDAAREAMRAESWYTPEEAVDAGLASAITREFQATTMAVPQSFRFKNTPKKVAIVSVMSKETIEKAGPDVRSMAMQLEIALTRIRQAV